MKMKNLTKLNLATLLAVLVLNVEVSYAKLPKSFTQHIKTTNKEVLKDPYFQIKSFKIKELTEEEALAFNDTEVGNKDFVNPILPTIPLIPPIPPAIGGIGVSAGAGTVDGIIMTVDKLIAVGQKIIPLIKSGSPVVTNNPMQAISVLPRSEAKDQAVHDMGEWSIPVSKHYRIAYSNGFGSEVISFVYSISFQYNGSVEGKGKYLAGVRASARNISISWGYDLDASSQLIQISNVGTQKDVIAGATIEMSYTVKNFTRTISTAESFYVTGDGKLYKVD